MNSYNDIYYQEATQFKVIKRGNNFQVGSDLVNVIMDEWVFKVWSDSKNANLQSILKKINIENFQQEDIIRATLACLCVAGLLERKTSTLLFQERVIQFSHENLVSIIIVAYDGKKWLEKLLPTIQRQSYKKFEIVIIDNASPSLEMYEWLLKTFPEISVIRSSKPLSFAAANNLGIEYSKGDYYLLLNQDTLLEENSIGLALETILSNKDAAAVALMLRLSWSPSFLNGLGNFVSERTWGGDIGYGILDIGQFSEWKELPSACFAAAMIPKKAIEEVGLLDQNFPMYYEDSEWCYRARSLGWKIYAAPNAKVLHAFGGGDAISGNVISAKKLTNACYGRLRFALKLTNGKTLIKFLTNYFIEDVINFIKSLIKGKFDLCLGYFLAWLHFLFSFIEISKQKREIFEKRKIGDNELFYCLNYSLPLAHVDGIPYLSKSLIENYYYPIIKNKEIKKMPEFDPQYRKPRLLIVSNDVVDKKMAGPGMRYLEMSKALSPSVNVTLAIPNKTDMKVEGIRLITYSDNDPSILKVLTQNHDYALINGYMIDKFPFLKKTETPLIIDLYDPFFFENLYYYTDLAIEEQLELNRQAIEVANKLAEVGSFFICGNERQRDLWLGFLAANHRVNPYTYNEDETLRDLIDVVGVGLPEIPPVAGNYLRNKLPGFDENSKIVLWGGGIWNWLDPITLIKAWPIILEKIPQAKLVFLGTKHPNPLVPEHKVANEAIQLAKQINEFNKSIVFIEWIDYDKRQFLLSEADAGVTLHSSSIETRYSIRTRIIDYFWGGLPTLVTDGDITSEWVRKYKVGEVVNPKDVKDVVVKLIKLLNTPKENFRPGFEKIREDLVWSKQVEPLKRYCLDQKRAADFDLVLSRHKDEYQKMILVPEPKNKFREALFIYATEGWRPMWSKVIFHLRWLISKKNR